MSKVPSNEYELLHQFEVIFLDGEHKTQDASRDYSKVWESIIDNPPAEGVTPIHVYRLNGTTCAVIAGMDELLDNEECAMEIARLAAAHSDHLRAVKLAQIEVLEEASKLICKRCDSGDPFPHKKNQNPYSTAKTLCHAARIHALIAALRKELEHE